MFGAMPIAEGNIVDGCGEPGQMLLGICFLGGVLEGVVEEIGEGRKGGVLIRRVVESRHGPGVFRLPGAVVSDIDPDFAVDRNAVVILDRALMEFRKGDRIGPELELPMTITDDAGGCPGGEVEREEEADQERFH